VTPAELVAARKSSRTCATARASPTHLPMLAKARVLGDDLAGTAYEELVRDFVR
jgi:hypothetical protein